MKLTWPYVQHYVALHGLERFLAVHRKDDWRGLLRVRVHEADGTSWEGVALGITAQAQPAGREAFTALARLTMTCVDLFGHKHAAIYDFTHQFEHQFEWRRVTIACVPMDLADLRKQVAGIRSGPVAGV